MKTKPNYPGIFALSIVGYVCMLFLRYVQGIFSSALKITGMLLNINPKIYAFLDLFPECFIIAFWCIIVFKYLNKISLQDAFSKEIPRKFAVRLGLFTLGLFLLLISLRYIENVVWDKTNYDYSPVFDLMKISTLINQLLNIVEIIIIIIGFLKVINSKDQAANRDVTIE